MGGNAVTTRLAACGLATAIVLALTSPVASAEHTTGFGCPLNFRDIATADSTHAMTPSLVFRSDHLAGAAGDCLQRFKGGTIVDLRREREVADLPDPAVAGAAHFHRDVWSAGLSGVWSAGLAAPARGMVGYLSVRGVHANPATWHHAFEEFSFSEAKQAGAYPLYVSMPGARAVYAQTIREIAAGSFPLVFHCQEGKDRTGILAVLLLVIAGVSAEDIVSDYVRSGDQLADPTAVQLYWLAGALEEIERGWGGFDNYFSEGLGLDGETLNAVRMRLRPVAVEP